jgi:hypothetical protein
MIALGILAVFAAVVIYQRVLAYDAAAVRHLPPDTLEVVRIDVERVLVYEPMRRHWFPLVDEIGLPSPAPAELRIKRIREATQIELGLDLREIVLGRGSSPADWVLVLGGKFSHKGFAAGMARVLTEEGTRCRVSEDGRVAVSASGLSFAQADDGVIIIGPTEARVRAALPASRTYEQLGIPLSGGAAIAAKGEPLGELVNSIVPRAPAIAMAGRVERVTGELSLGTPARGRLVLRFAPGTDTARAEAQVRRALAELEKSVSGRPELAPFATPLKSAQVSSTVSGIVEVSFDWPEAEIDRGAADVAAWLRRREK